MANLASTDITVTILNNRRGENGRKNVNVQLAFGDGAKTYPAGGIPVNAGNLGCPNSIESFDIYDNGLSGYVWSFDRTNKKLVAVQSPSHTHTLFLKNANVADGATTRLNAGGVNAIGANTGSDVSVAGVANIAGAGGIVNVAAGGLTETAAVAIAAQVLRAEIIGW